MFLWNILQVCLICLVVIFVVSQIILPPFIGKRFFWIFLKSEKEVLEADASLIDARNEKEAQRIRKEVSKLQK